MPRRTAGIVVFCALSLLAVSVAHADITLNFEKFTTELEKPLDNGRTRVVFSAAAVTLSTADVAELAGCSFANPAQVEWTLRGLLLPAVQRQANAKLKRHRITGKLFVRVLDDQGNELGELSGKVRGESVCSQVAADGEHKCTNSLASEASAAGDSLLAGLVGPSSFFFDDIITGFTPGGTWTMAMSPLCGG